MLKKDKCSTLMSYCFPRMSDCYQQLQDNCPIHTEKYPTVKSWNRTNIRSWISSRKNTDHFKNASRLSRCYWTMKQNILKNEHSHKLLLKYFLNNKANWRLHVSWLKDMAGNDFAVIYFCKYCFKKLSNIIHKIIDRVRCVHSVRDLVSRHLEHCWTPWEGEALGRCLEMAWVTRYRVEFTMHIPFCI